MGFEISPGSKLAPIFPELSHSVSVPLTLCPLTSFRQRPPPPPFPIFILLYDSHVCSYTCLHCSTVHTHTHAHASPPPPCSCHFTHFHPLHFTSKTLGLPCLLTCFDRSPQTLRRIPHLLRPHGTLLGAAHLDPRPRRPRGADPRRAPQVERVTVRRGRADLRRGRPRRPLASGIRHTAAEGRRHHRVLWEQGGLLRHPLTPHPSPLAPLLDLLPCLFPSPRPLLSSLYASPSFPTRLFPFSQPNAVNALPVLLLFRRPTPCFSSFGFVISG